MVNVKEYTTDGKARGITTEDDMNERLVARETGSHYQDVRTVRG